MTKKESVPHESQKSIFSKSLPKTTEIFTTSSFSSLKNILSVNEITVQNLKWASNLGGLSHSEILGVVKPEVDKRSPEEKIRAYFFQTRYLINVGLESYAYRLSAQGRWDTGAQSFVVFSSAAILPNFLVKSSFNVSRLKHLTQNEKKSRFDG